MDNEREKDQIREILQEIPPSKCFIYYLYVSQV